MESLTRIHDLESHKDEFHENWQAVILNKQAPCLDYPFSKEKTYGAGFLPGTFSSFSLEFQAVFRIQMS